MKQTIKERILKRIKIDDAGCWLLKPNKSCGGYAIIEINGVSKRAHRVSYETFVGPVPEGLLVLHHCDIRHCVCPDHLWIGTHKDNTQDMILKGRSKLLGGKRGPRGPMKRSYGRGTLTQEDVDIIRSLHSQGSSYKDLALTYNTSPKYIYRVCAGLVWNKKTST